MAMASMRWIKHHHPLVGSSWRRNHNLLVTSPSGNLRLREPSRLALRHRGRVVASQNREDRTWDVVVVDASGGETGEVASQNREDTTWDVVVVDASGGETGEVASQNREDRTWDVVVVDASGGETGEIDVKAGEVRETGSKMRETGSKMRETGSKMRETGSKMRETRSKVMETFQLGMLFCLWYVLNISFNIYNKQVLREFPYPITVTCSQFLVGSVLALLTWVHKKPPVLTMAQLQCILPLACAHTLGNVFTNMSLGKVSVSFTHTIKAMEPFFAVILSGIFLREIPNPLVIASLVPIVVGVGFASMTEYSFNWEGFLTAIASNATSQSRNVFSKKFMVKEEGGLDNVNLFSTITIMSFFLLLPVAWVVEGITPHALSRITDVKVVASRALVAGLCLHLYQQLSFMILEKVSPVSHSVGNCVKRVVVIVTSVLFFQTPVSIVNGLGTGLALAGVCAYSQLKSRKPDPIKTE